ncbi:hypothetical protein C8Q76DRAFT_698391 [Earliella scabrosa]|nr:hypothetical protein C8Q76DRAFT_698391 [Earliella scabrosa]
MPGSPQLQCIAKPSDSCDPSSSYLLVPPDMYQRPGSNITDADNVSTSALDELSPLLSALHVGDAGSINDSVHARRNHRRVPRAEAQAPASHVMRVTINAGNVTIYNGAAPAYPASPRPYPHVGRGQQLAPAPPADRNHSLPGEVALPMDGGEPEPAVDELARRAHSDAEGSTIASDQDSAPAQYFADPDPYHRGRWYVVTAGTRVGVWKAWVDMAHHVTNVRGNAHQRFKTREEAMHWYETKKSEGRVVLLAP